MLNSLPKVKIDGKVYWQDDRLREYRHVTNTMDRIKFDEICERKVEAIEQKQSINPVCRQAGIKPKLR
jgi:diphthamide synthase (EF-2-diphthine--ammonia ligase)